MNNLDSLQLARSLTTLTCQITCGIRRALLALNGTNKVRSRRKLGWSAITFEKVEDADD